MNLRWMATAAVAMGLAGLGAGQAEAALALRIESGATSVTITDNGAGDALNATLGAIAYTGVPFGNYIFIVDAAAGFPAIGSPTLPELRILTNNGAAVPTFPITDAQPLTVTVTQTDFVSTSTNYEIGATATLPTADTGAVATAVYNFFYDSTNSLFGLANNVGMIDFSFLAGGPAQSENMMTSFSPATPFSLTTQVVLSGIDAGQGFSSSSVIQAVPEPMTLALLGTGLLGLGLAKRRRV